MLFNTVICCSILSVIVHHVSSQSAVSQDSSNTTIIIIISVTAAVVAVAVIVAIVVGYLYFKRSVKTIRKNNMKIIMNSTTKHMVRIERLGTMDEFFNEVEADENGLFPELPEVEEEVSDDEEKDEDRIVDEDTTDVVEVEDEVSPEEVIEVANIPRDTEQIKNELRDNDKNIESKEDITFFLKKEPSFLNFIVKEHWKRPKVPDIAKSRLDVKQDKLKRKRTSANKNQSMMVPRLRSTKKLKKLRPQKHRYDYFMKPMRTTISEYKWSKRKPRSKIVSKQKQNIVNTNRKTGSKLMLSIHEEL